MKQLGYRLDVSFMALVSRCLLPESGTGPGTPSGSNVCGMIADDYNDRILNQEIFNHDVVLNNKMVIPEDMNVNMNVHTMGNAKNVLKRMKEFRVNVMNSTLTYYDLREVAEWHYQELKNLRKQQWKVEKDAATSWWPLSLRPAGHQPTKIYTHTHSHASYTHTPSHSITPHTHTHAYTHTHASYTHTHLLIPSPHIITPIPFQY